MTPTQNAATPEVQAAFLVALAEAGVTPDVGELLVQGNSTRGVPPGVLAKALNAIVFAAPAASEGQEVPTSADFSEDEHGDIVTIAYMMGRKDEKDYAAALARAGGDGWLPIEDAPEGNEDEGPFFDVAWFGETHRYLPVLRREVDCYRQGGAIKRQHSYPAVTTVFLRKPTHFKLSPALPAPDVGEG